jgi:hypothetical protein
MGQGGRGQAGRGQEVGQEGVWGPHQGSHLNLAALLVSNEA